MTRWGVFDEKTPPHVMPCDEEGFVLSGHLAADYCWCKPTTQSGWKNGKFVPVIVHHDVELTPIKQLGERCDG